VRIKGVYARAVDFRRARESKPVDRRDNPSSNKPNRPPPQPAGPTRLAYRDYRIDQLPDFSHTRRDWSSAEIRHGKARQCAEFNERGGVLDF